jgi:hypothetical protein
MTGRSPPRKPNLATVIMMIIGVAALATAGVMAVQTVLFLSHAARTTGMVSDPRQHPKIRFTTAGGTAVEFVQNGWVSRPAGAPVPVAYDPRDPAGTAQVATVWACWGLPLWLLPMGLGFTLLPLFGFQAEFRGSRDAEAET